MPTLIDATRKTWNENDAKFKGMISALSDNMSQADHTHYFTRGILPGGIKIKTCACGTSVEITPEEWETIPAR